MRSRNIDHTRTKVKSRSPTALSNACTKEHRLSQEAKGDLTIKGITKPTDFFPIVVALDGKTLTANAELQVDRTLYNIKYHSLKFFSDLGDKVIHDKFTIHTSLKATK